jgi:ketosteroid isomerase-like protein
MAEVEARLARLEARLRELEDRIEIYQLLSAYGPLVDSGDAEATSRLWVEDGVYDWGGGPRPADGAAVAKEGWAGAAYSRAEIEAMVRGPAHRSIIESGAGHVIGLPHVELAGDTAVATGYARLYRRDGDGFAVARVSANRWELVRTAAGWRVATRTNRVLDGGEAPRALLRAGVAAPKES